MPRKSKRRTRRKIGGDPETKEELEAKLIKYQEKAELCKKDKTGKHADSCEKVAKKVKRYTKLLKNREKAKARWGKVKNTVGKLAVPVAAIKSYKADEKCAGKSAEEKFNIYCHKPFDNNTQGWPAWKNQYHDEPFTMYNYITKQTGDLGTCDGVQLSNSLVHYSPHQAPHDGKDAYPNPMENCVSFKGSQDTMGFQEESFPIEFDTKEAWENVKEFHNILPELAKDYAEEFGVSGKEFDKNDDFWIKKYLLEEQAVFGGGRRSRRRRKSRKKRRKSKRKKSRRKRKRSRRRRRR